MRGLRVEESRLQKIRGLTEISRILTYSATLDEVFQLTVARAAELLTAEKALLMVANDEGLLALRSSHGVDGALAKRLHGPLTETLIPRLAEILNAPPGGLLGVPLFVSGTIKGILLVIRPAASTTAELDEWLLSALADQAAVAMEKSRLDEVGEFREQLIGIVGHDLRTPLNAILMAANTLVLREGLGEYETELGRKIIRSAKLAARLIEQLLDLTRSRLGGGIPVDPRSLDLNKICRQVIGESEIAHPDRPVQADFSGNLTGVWDGDRIYQLLANLIGNAVKHGEPRSPIVLRAAGGEHEVVIEVANRGEPIPPQLLPFIFDAFRKARGEHPSGQKGLGLGLFIAQQIARSHGGSIAVTSSLSEGTTFRVRLPRGSTAAAG